MNIRKLRRILSIFLSASMLLLCVAGCHKNSTDVKKPKDGSIYGGSVTVGITQEPSCFDPHLVVAAGDEEILFNIFEGLYKFSQDGSVNPCLATDCTISDDATQYTFTIREGVKFHDGSDMTVNDVVYSLKRASGLLTGEAAPVAELGCITEVSASGNNVTVTIDSPNYELLSCFTAAIIPEHVDDINNNPIGTGPFKFENYSIGQNVVITKNENYWQPELPYLDSVEFKICADMDSGVLEMTHGSIDIFPHLTKQKADQLNDKFTSLSAASNMVQLLALNNQVKPFDNATVREAINLALNRDELINLSMDGAGVQLISAMSPAMGEYYNNSLTEYTQDISKAKQLLADAGYPNGFNFTITVCSSYLVHVNTAIAIQDQLSAIGVNVDIEQVDWNTWLSETYTNRNYEGTVVCLTSQYSPFDIMSRYDSTNGGNFINYESSEYDSIIRSIPTVKDTEERIKLYKNLQELMINDSASCYIQDPQEIVGISKDLTGYNVYPMYVQDMSTVHYN